MRLNRYIARTGYCSRRQADLLIRKGKVEVNGVPIREFHCRVAESDRVKILGKCIKIEKTRLFIYYKPIKTLVSTIDSRGRSTIFRDVPHGLFPVGRLDYMSEGLLLLTNDGLLARKLELPSNAYLRTYLVWVHGKLRPEWVKKWQAGTGGYAPAKIKIKKGNPQGPLLEWTLVEGKNREIRRLCATAGLVVTRLLRVRYAGIALGKLSPRDWKEIPCSTLPRDT